ncbi:hypothetical protein K440DRAFT_641676 [Wilcoxina mikolae CBS 423.85]|nr:hypothetical protein K440DRAFT_641676 [Wilcoxina mikolae CBS 423.85]
MQNRMQGGSSAGNGGEGYGSASTVGAAEVLEWDAARELAADPAEVLEWDAARELAADPAPARASSPAPAPARPPLPATAPAPGRASSPRPHLHEPLHLHPHPDEPLHRDRIRTSLFTYTRTISVTRIRTRSLLIDLLRSLFHKWYCFQLTFSASVASLLIAHKHDYSFFFVQLNARSSHESLDNVSNWFRICP